MRHLALIVATLLTIQAFGQTPPSTAKSHPSAGKDVGSGAASIGKGVGSGAYEVGKGTAGAVGNLVTGHPISAATSLGKGAGKGGLRIATGTVKGVGKMSRGAGKGLLKLTHL